MKIIDGKGRLFGKINLIDLLVIVFIILLIGRFAVRLDFNKINEGQGVETNEKEFKYTVFVEKVRPVTVNAVKPGDIVRDGKTNVVIGEVVEVRSEPHVAEIPTSDGELALAESKIYKDMYIKLRTRGIVTPNVILVGKKEIRIGTTFLMSSTYYSVISTVWDIEVD